MMTALNPRLKLEICAFFADEFRAALAAEKRGDIELVPVQGACDERRRPALTETPPAQSETLALRMMGACSGGIESACAQRRAHPAPPHSCFEFLLGPDKVDALLGEGAHLLTPAMARAYPETLQSQNEKTESLHAYFAESVRAWVVVDTGVTKLTAAEQAAFLAATGGKIELLPTEPHLLRANLRAALAQWEASTAGASFAGQITSLQHRLADYTMAYDLIGRLIPYQGEQTIVQGILELFYMLCAPRAVHLLLVQDGGQDGKISLAEESVQIFSLPADSDKEDFLRTFLHCPAPWGETGMPQQGFYFQIHQGKQTLGVVVVEGVFLPEHQRNYLELAHLLMPILRLALHNARSYERLCNTEHELRASQMELEQRVDERTKELRESEERLKEAQRIAQLGSWELDIVKDKLAWSDEVFRLFEMDQSKLKGTYKGFLDAIHPDDREAVDSAYTRSLEARKPYEVTHRLLMSDGRIKWVTERCTSYFDAEGKPLRSAGTIQDVTEHKRVEEELKLGAQILNSISDTVFLLDPDGNFIYLNEAAWKSRGYTRDEMMGMSLRELNAPEYNNLLASRIKAVMENGYGFFESAHRCKDGTVMPVEINVRVTESGGRKLLLSVIRDITWRRQAEKELREKSQLFDSIVENIPNMIFLKRASDLRFELFNRAGEALVGHGRGELLGRNDYDFFPKEQADFFTGMDRATLKQDGIVDIPEEPIKTPRGTRILHTKKLVLKDEHGQPQYLLGISEDITERKHAQAALERHKTVIDTAQDGFWMYDTSGYLLEVNQAYADMMGYTREELTGMHISKLSVPSNTPELVRARMDKIISQGASSHFETQHRHKDGHIVHFETSNTYMPESNLAFSFLRDITKRKEYEEELRRSNIELEQFSYAVSHDMRQPLRMISSYLQLIEMSLGRQLDDEKRSYFDFAIEGAKRIDQMLVALLEYSRVGRMGEPPAWIESRAILDEALQFLQPAITEAQARVNIAGEWPRILVSHDEILRLLQNLIGNAAKFRIAGRTPEITVTSKVAGNEWHLSVADNGVGIIPSQIKRLFQVFQRLQLRTAYEGNGVGLALCRKIAEHHKGRIWAESTGEKQGSKFCVVLPVLPNETISARGGNT